uniref:ATP binding cassette subfamily A member 8 n=1 Tax=Mustela putorius furo TaxID=9669 RepID=M3YSL9_MUSPF
MMKREISVCQQTWALLCKNLLKKWRLKRESFMEWLTPLLLLLCLSVYPTSHEFNDFSSLPAMDLGRVDSFKDSTFSVIYTPVTNTTQQIMNKVALASFMKDAKVLGLSKEKNIKELMSDNPDEVIQVIFTNTFSYHLKFLLGYRIPTKKEHRDHEAHIYEKTYIRTFIAVAFFSLSGCQAYSRNIINVFSQTATNHSVMEELMSVTGKNMKIHPFVSQGGIEADFFIFFCIISFSSFTYYASLNVTRERKKMKGLMRMMGLQDSAFWLSWGLLYGVFIFIMALSLALIIKSVQFVILTGFTAIFTLFFLYGLSLIALAFLMSVLVKKSFLTGLVVFLLTVFWGSLGFTALYRQLPTSLEWILSFLSPFAFTLGMAQLLRLDYDLNSNAFPNPSDYSNLIIATNFMLAFDLLFYMALTIYFEKILPNEYGHGYPPFFFLKSSFWSRQQKADHVVLEDEIDSDPSSNDSFEPVSPEFHGKEAIRIKPNTQKFQVQKLKPGICTLIKDLVFDIYEGQITAILGHSGAGKSTLLNILSGLSVPTKGSVTIYNNKLSEISDLENIIKLTGICPQSNVQFDFLTVKENLRLFAKIKGIQSHEVDKEVLNTFIKLYLCKSCLNVGPKSNDMNWAQRVTPNPFHVSPQILYHLITLGHDLPGKNGQLPNKLSSLLFSISDRKVFLSKGKLKCAGSSLFLKKKWGIGYHLNTSLQLNETHVQENITSLIKQHIPDAKLSAESEGKLVYTLPLERTNRFPAKYSSVHICPSMEIQKKKEKVNLLSQAFLRAIGKISNLEEAYMATLGEAQAERTGDTERLVEMEQVLSSLNETTKTIGGLALWKQQICMIARVHFLNLKHERKALLSLLLILGVGICPLLLRTIHNRIYEMSYTWELSPHLYFLAPGQSPHDPLTQLLIINTTGASIDDFIHSVEHQNIALEVDVSGTKTGVDDLSYNGAIIVSGNTENYSFSLACNTKRLNCFPVLMDIISNALLGMIIPSAHIQTDRSTFIVDRESSSPYEFQVYTIFWLILISSCSPYIAMSSIDDYKSKVQSQLWISGLFPSAYWCGQALVDVPMYSLSFLLMYLIDYGLNFDGTLMTLISEIIQILCSFGYAASLIFLTYVISFIFRKGKRNSGIWSFCFFMICSISVFILFFESFGHVTLYCITFLVPQATLIGCMLLYYEVAIFYFLTEEELASVEAFLIVLIPFLHFIIFLFILRCLQWKFGKKSMKKDPFFRISPRNPDVCQNPEAPEGEDEDVQMERMRTADALNSTNFEEKPVIIASCLRKEYAEKRKCCLSKRKKKIATRNVSFCVRKGEVLGLLGHNGAGKSTSIRMITADTKPSAGQVLLKGSNGEASPGFLGYCPQENVLWPSLTVKEHLEVFAAIKGLRKVDAAVTIARLADALKLQDQLKQPVKALSVGIKRKLCFALSILGNPSVVLLDEPSTGMDPEGQLQMWQAIRATVKDTERGALLTTHYMAEAEAVCDRVAIMVSGKLRCIGSIQHLKSKFGKNYLLEMKVKTLAQRESLHQEILRVFPRAARQERYSSVMVYKLPVEDVRPLAQAFFMLEKVKQSFDLEEYSLSQSTLEQVFLELSKEQELDDFDEELDPSVKWKLLPQEDP